MSRPVRELDEVSRVRAQVEVPDELELDKAWPRVADLIAYVEKATAGR